MGIDYSVFLHHAGYSVAAALIATGISLGLGWLFGKLIVRIDKNWSFFREFSTLIPMRTAVFGVAATSFLSPLGLMYFVLYFGLTQFWTLYSASVALIVVGTWLSTNIFLDAASIRWSERRVFRLVRTLFVVSPWICIRPGQFTGGGGAGTPMAKGVAQLNFDPVIAAVMWVAVLSLLLDFVFGVWEFVLIRKGKRITG